MASTEYNRAKWKKIKDDPKLHAEYTEINNRRCREERSAIRLDPEKYAELKKKWRERANAWRENLRLNNPDRYAELLRKEREAQKRKQQKSEYRKYQRNWLKAYFTKRRKEDPVFRMVQSMRCTISRALRGKKKADHTLSMVGCTADQLARHLEDRFELGMSWENYGHGADKWTVDHIRPCASFDLTKIDEQLKCFHFTNLRPLWFLENISKGSLYKGARHRYEKAA